MRLLDSLELIGWENGLSEYEHKSVAATFTCQLRDLERQHPDASQLLGALAFFDPEKIPIEMLIMGAKTTQRPKTAPQPTTRERPPRQQSFAHKLKVTLFGPNVNPRNNTILLSCNRQQLPSSH
jgi:hypothetical protein